MTNQFITNQEKLLSEVMGNILPSTRAVHFLVGYFYFSGFQEIYKELLDKQIRVLVGLEIERKLSEQIIEFDPIIKIKKVVSHKAVQDNFYESLRTFFNESNYFDSVEKQEAFKIFLQKIRDGSLVIKKTLEPNHAKLYLFEKKFEVSENGQSPGVVITGSSNLTSSGLSRQFEINAVFRDKDDYEEAKGIFEVLWEKSIEVVGPETVKYFEDEVVQKIWYEKVPDPYLMYIRVLEEHFAYEEIKGIRYPGQITKGNFKDLKYQTDAINEALDKIKTHDGVLVADVVGLGKSIIASTIANNLSLKTIVIAPPHLKDQWEEYRFEFHFNAIFYSSGKIEEALKHLDEAEPMLIIIDEAHKYRNEDTRDYENLSKLCAGNKVVLLTATPYNNSPSDIRSMIKLFQIPQNSTIKTVKNLSVKFQELSREYKAIKEAQKEGKESKAVIAAKILDLTAKLRDLIGPLIIRRSRLDLLGIKEYRQDLKDQDITLPEVEDPYLEEYKLGALVNLYENTLRKIHPQDDSKGFIGARYKPVTYLKNIEKYKKQITEDIGDENLFRQSQKNLAKFMKHLLVKRFESSIAAFKSTLDNMLYSMKQMKVWHEDLGEIPIYKKGNLPEVPDPSDYSGESYESDMSIFNEAISGLEEKGLHKIPKTELKNEFIEDLNRDIELLEEIKRDWESLEHGLDPKFEAFKKLIKKLQKENPHRKIIVFSEFKDTANYIYGKLNDKRAFFYSSAEAGKTNRDIIKKNFDAEYKGMHEDNYDILIATDAMSEGVNLHRAGVVINYDIPYNPTRVIQRLGRINRIGKKMFDKLRIYNFFPSIVGEPIVRISQIANLKMSMIQALLGEDTKILDPGETLQSFLEKMNKSSGEYSEKFRTDIDGDFVSWETAHKDNLKNVKKEGPEVFKEAMSLPKRSRVGRLSKLDKGVIVFGKKGADSTFWFGQDKDDLKPLTAKEAISKFEAKKDEKGKSTSSKFWGIYTRIKEALFRKSEEVLRDRIFKQTVDKIEYLISEFFEEKSYLSDLKTVFEVLNCLSEGHAKQIRAIHKDTLKEDLMRLKKDLPHSYLIKMITKSNRIDEGEESVILAEEFI